jgi:restriction system protein
VLEPDKPLSPSRMPREHPRPPSCPLCSTPMVVRTARRGANAGSQFWGCPNYPRCRGIRPFVGAAG